MMMRVKISYRIVRAVRMMRAGKSAVVGVKRVVGAVISTTAADAAAGSTAAGEARLLKGIRAVVEKRRRTMSSDKEKARRRKYIWLGCGELGNWGYVVGGIRVCRWGSKFAPPPPPKALAG